MQFSFWKYQGAGNDFVILDGFNQVVHLTEEQIKLICDRHFGIGADGLMILLPHGETDFYMQYFNSDGKPSSMCGNGGRCLVNFAWKKERIHDACTFMAVDGLHQALCLPDGQVSLQMSTVDGVELLDNGSCVLDTGSPHLVIWVDDVDAVDVFQEGRKWRNHPRFVAAGINVNFVQVRSSDIKVRTYERGVENETLSCGTGVTAAALAASFTNRLLAEDGLVGVETPGGLLEVKFTQTTDAGYQDIWLTGPAIEVYKGEFSNDSW